MTSLNEPKRTFGHSHLSVDCVVLGFDGDNIRVLLLKRNDFELHDMKLPGDIIYADETLDEAAHRVIRDYTGMKDLEMVQFQTFSSIDRIDDPRDVHWLESYLQEKVTRVVTAAYFSIMRISKFAAYGGVSTNKKNDKKKLLEFIDIYKNHKICHKRYLIERFKFFIFYQQPLHILSSMLKKYTESRTQSNQENRLIR